MKKSLIALAVLAASGAAMAQSSVTLFGVVDLGLRSVSQGGSRVTGQSQDGITSSRIGFRGVEDLGGGLSASFWLEGALQPDVGTANGLSFQRRSTISLSGGFGEVRLGRDYTPTFWNHTVFDVFGTNGVGSSINTLSVLNSGASTSVRANNTFGYFLPGNLGGFYGQAQVALKEADVRNTAGEYAGVRLGYMNGPLNVAVAAANEGSTSQANSYKRWNVGASYDLGVAKVVGYYNHGKFANLSQKVTSIGVSVPMGAAELKASYNNANGNGNNDANQVALGAVYNLSKRTAVYGTYARISNKGASNYSVGAFAGQAAVTAGGSSSGFEAGIRHSF